MARHIGSDDRDGTLGRALGAHARMVLDLARGRHSDAIAYAAMPGDVPPALLGYADWDGTIRLGDRMLATVGAVFEGRARVGSQAEMYALVQCLHTCLHEHAHLVLPAGQTFAQHEREFARWPVALVEEGTTEAWSQDNLARFLRLHEPLVPGLDAGVAGGSYSAFVPAVRQIARSLGDRLGVPERDVIALLNRHGPASKLRTVAYLGLRAGDAWERMPAERRRRSVSTVAGVVAAVLERGRRWALRDGEGQAGTHDVEGRSTIMGLQVVAAVDRAVRELRHRHVAPDPDWHRTALSYELALARYARGLARGRHRDTGKAAAEWYGEAKSRLLGARALSPKASTMTGRGM